jgi:hypothetical protein
MLVNYFFKEKNTSYAIHTFEIHLLNTKSLKKKQENVSKLFF